MMLKYTHYKKHTLLLLFISFISFSQSNKRLVTDNYSLTNPGNELSNYFKEKIPKRFLKEVTFEGNLNAIDMTFFINSEQKPFGIKLNTFGNSEISEYIEKAFENFPIEKLNIDNISTKKMYSLQIISGTKKKKIFDCSEIVSSKTLPYCDTCNDLEYYADIQSCIQKEIKKHFLKQIDFAIIKRFKTERTLNILLEIVVGSEGKLYLKKAKASKIFEPSLENAVRIFPAFHAAATSNTIKTAWEYKLNFSFNKNKLPTFKEKKTDYDKFYKRNSTNDFALYLKKNITAKELGKANLSRIHNKVMLAFELNKKGNPFNIVTNARSNSLNNAIISSFKNYPIANLDFPEKKRFNYYSTQILGLSADTTIIKTNSMLGFERISIHPKCEKSKSIEEGRHCFSRNIQKHFSKNFDAKLPNRLGLSAGRKKILIGFTIDAQGAIKNIKTEAPHAALKAEATRVMEKLSKVQPAVRNNAAVAISYRIPFSLFVE
jgi:hypothetical protein